MTDTPAPPTEVRPMMSLEAVLALVPCSRASVFRMESAGTFPRSRLVQGRKAWFADEIAAWQSSLPPSQVARRRRSA